MTRPVLRLLGGLLIALLGVVHTVAAETLAPAEMYADANASRLLLVTFRDRGIERMAAGPRLNQYMTRRAYAATTWSRRRSAALADDYHLRELAAWPVSEIGQHCVVFLVPADVSVADVSTRLAADPRVEIVQPMTQYATMGSATSGDPYFALQSALQEIPIEAIHARTTGAGVHVAIIDTGADDTHPDLAGQFQLARDFTQGAPAVAGDLHGTAVAGIIAAKRGNGLGIVGLAPDARLQVYKACWQRAAQDMLATCNTFTLALALNTALREHAQVINLSLSGPEDAILTALIRTALARGVVIVAALSDAGGGFPASVPGVIAVASDAVAAAESTLQAVSAPGHDILTTMPHGAYDFISGSSFSAAHVTGLVALRLALEPAATAADIHAGLRNGHQQVARLLALIAHRN